MVVQSVFQLMISFLLVAITASGVVAGQKEAVLDTKGNPVKANAWYYIFGSDGKMVFTDSSYAMKFRICPLRVTVSSPPPIARRVMFELSSDVVRVSTELKIKFSGSGPCPPGTKYWRVGGGSKSLFLDGSKSSNNSTFTIKKYRGANYTLAFGNTDINLESRGLEYGLRLYHNFGLPHNFGFPFYFVPALA